MCFPPNRLTRKTPTLHLPWRRPRREKGKRPDTHTGRPDERGRRKKQERREKKNKTEKNRKKQKKKRKREQKEKHLP
jgi:hypothetical protein